MSRSGYSEDCEYLSLYRGTVARATYGKRGQAFFRDLVAALDAMPVKRLVEGSFETQGEVCALGALGRSRGLDMNRLAASNKDELGEVFGIARQLAAETMYENDEGAYGHYRKAETPEQRWTRVRKWAAGEIKPAVTP